VEVNALKLEYDKVKFEGNIEEWKVAGAKVFETVLVIESRKAQLEEKKLEAFDHTFSPEKLLTKT
jgi:hypothetical protein